MYLGGRILHNVQKINYKHVLNQIWIEKIMFTNKVFLKLNDVEKLFDKELCKIYRAESFTSMYHLHKNRNVNFPNIVLIKPAHASLYRPIWIKESFIVSLWLFKTFFRLKFTVLKLYSGSAIGTPSWPCRFIWSEKKRDFKWYLIWHTFIGITSLWMAFLAMVRDCTQEILNWEIG